MKKILFILVVTFFTLASCKSKGAKEASVAGKWKPVEMNLKQMKEEEKKDAMENTTIEFSTDGKFNATTKTGKQNGTYTYNEKDKTLTVSSATGESRTQKFIIGWEGNTMVMTNEEGVVKLKRQ